jgi:hypothetical protein
MSVFLAKVAQDLLSQFGDNLHQCHLVFNNNRPALYLKKYLAQHIGKAFFSPNFHTVQAFFAHLADTKIADSYLQTFTLMKVYNELLQAEGKNKVRSEAFFPLATTILSDFAQIDAEMVNADQLFAEMYDIADIEQSFDYLSKEQHAFLSKFWQSYNEIKHQERKQKFIELWKRMPKLYRAFHAELKKQGFTTYGATYHNLALNDWSDNAFLKSLDKGKIVFIGFNALSRAEVKIFKTLQALGKAVFYFDADSHYLNDDFQEAGLFLRKNFKTHGLENALETSINGFTDKKQLHVFAAQGKSSQAKIINQLIDFSAIDVEKISDTAIILADESLLIPTLQSIPENVPLNISMGFSLMQSPIYGICDLWLDTQLALEKSDQLDYHLVEAVITHPMSGVSAKLANNILSKLIEENSTSVDASRLVKHQGLFQLFFNRIAGSAAAIDGLRALIQFLLERQVERKLLRQIDSSLFVRCLQSLNRLADTLQVFIAQEELFFAVQLLRKALKEVSTPLEESSSLGESATSGLQVMGLLESRSLNFKNIVFLGFNEGIVPKSSLANSFIPDSIRRAYGLPVSENLDAVSAYMVYRLIQGGQQINMVYNSQSDGGNSGEISRFFKQIAYECPFDVKQYQMNLQGTSEERQTVKIDKNLPAIQEKLASYLNGKSTLSPSAIVSYICNPIDFFFSQIAKIREPNVVTDEVKVNEIGSVLHKVMEDFYKPYCGEEISAELIRQRGKQLSAICQKAFNEVMQLSPQFNNYRANQKIVLEVVERYAGKLLKKDQDDAPFTLIALEHRFDGELKLTIRGKVERIKLKGIIDRIDQKDGVTRIIDYKTGSDSVTYSSIENLFDTSKKINKAMIQMLIYAYVYAEQHPDLQVKPHLYVLKDLSKTCFSCRSKELDTQPNSEEMVSFMNLLRENLAQLFDIDVPFEEGEKAENFRYSIYTELYDTPAYQPMW